MRLQSYIARGKLVGGQRQHIADHRTQILLAQVQLHGARKVHQHLHHAVQAMDLRVDHFQMAQGGSPGLAQLVLQQFQMHHNGVDGVLHLMAHAGGEPSDGRHAARKLQIGLDFRRRLKIVHRDQRAQSLAGLAVVDEVQRGLDATPALGANLFLHQRGARLESIAQGTASAVELSEFQAHDCPAAFFFAVLRKRRAVSDTRTARPSLVKSRMPSCRLPRILSRFPCSAEKTSSTFFIRWPICSILLETRTAMSCRGVFLFFVRLFAAYGHEVELPADLLQRPQGEVAEQEGRYQRGDQRKAHQGGRRSQPRGIDGAQQRGAHAHMHGGKRRAIPFQRHGYVVDRGGPEDL